jgi:hypothetical protein
MCPGGTTIPTVNHPGLLALNGMSLSTRDSAFASSGLVATLFPETYGGTDLNSALSFRDAVERACFEAGHEAYAAPAQRLTDFLSSKPSTGSLPGCSYPLGITPARLDAILPREITDPLRSAIKRFDRTLDGFLHPEALALGPESRASSPVRIVRHPDTMEAPGIKGLLPVGEGAGYAGGIMSCALDGLNAASKIIERFAPPK